jgi:hypothetical protein
VFSVFLTGSSTTPSMHESITNVNILNRAIATRFLQSIFTRHFLVPESGTLAGLNTITVIAYDVSVISIGGRTPEAMVNPSNLLLASNSLSSSP